MKGVILNLDPQAVLVDLVHDIPPGHIEQAAVALLISFRYFPQGTIHVAVVDPGVGTDRRALAVQTDRYMFIGPDNGLLGYVLERSDGVEARFIENPAFMLPRVSRTFHGRDVFAPAAGYLAQGLPFEKIGPLAQDFQRLPGFSPSIEKGRITGRVVYVDRYGNLLTNIRNEMAPDRAGNPRLIVKDQSIDLVGTYGEGSPDTLVGVPGSSGFLEIAVNRGRADLKLGGNTGTQVVLLGEMKA